MRRRDLSASRTLLAGAVVWLVSLVASGCDGSNPVAPVGAGDPAPATSYSVSLSAAPSSATAGTGTPVTITVSVIDNATGAAPTAALDATVSTTLGTFAEGGTLVTLTVSGGSATATLMPGDVVGTAEVLARIGDSAGSVMVDVTDPGSPPEASFTFNASELSVIFVDTSTGDPTSWHWDFGDGNTSTEQDPSHVYAAAGGYSVRLTATNVGGDGTSAQVVEVYTRPTAGFDWCALGLEVAFTDTSTGGATSYTWTYGDGESESGNIPNPRHTYATGNSYLVTQDVSNPEGSASVTQTVKIPASVPNICTE